MKKIILTITYLVLILALAACSGNASEPETDSPSPNTGDGGMSMPLGTLLMLGTVMLEETEYAVDAEQADALLPLWKALRSFSESETTAQAELDAVITQIGETMTSEQISTIEGMELTREDMGSMAETLGVEMSGIRGGSFGDITPEMQETRQAMRESGEFQGPGSGQGPGGGLGGGQGPGGAEMDPDARATAIAERGGIRGASSGLDANFLEAFIEFLEAKTQ